ncbi:unnamed protein product [Adineta ricciae]|uniref:VIT domain-containing protein n=1 Tax=Adineta ricciae TaxID=249248 RepID=A0A813SG30_ADIRI|nr:unnamed protein product [Adineta ricciae]
MRSISIGLSLILIFSICVNLCQAETTTKRPVQAKNKITRRCQRPQNGQHICFCGKNKQIYDRMKGEKCFNGTVIFSKPQPKTLGLRLASKPIHQSTRDNDKELRCTGLIFKPPTDEVQKAYVPLRSVSVEATINAFAADVTLTQVFVNQEENHIEAIYVFPIEENAAVYSFTAQINNKTITAVLKEKAKAEKEYNTSVQQGHTSDVEDRKAVEERILQLSLDHGILSAYTAFVGVETSTPKDSNIKSVVRHIPIQISKGDEHLFQSSFSSNFNFMNYMQPQSLGVGPGQYPIAMSFAPAMSHRHGAISGMGLPGMRGPPPRPSGFAYASAPMGAAGLAADYDGAFVSTTTPGASLSHDPVRWLIRQQSFNGLWKLSDSDIRTLTSGKELSAFSSSVTQNRDALSTALVIAVLESKHGQESNLWSAVVSKGRKQLLALGLNSSEVNLLIEEMKKKL